MSKVNKTVSTIVAGAMTALTCIPAMAMDLRAEQDENVMAHWTFKLGGDEGRIRDRQSLGFTVNAPLGSNFAYSAHQSSNYLNQPGSRPAMMSLSLGMDGSFDRFSLNGNKIVDKDDVLYAGEEGEPMKILGVEWYYALFAGLAVAATGYLVYDAFEDDDDDEAAAGGGGGGTTGTPLDALLDPLAELAP